MAVHLVGATLIDGIQERPIRGATVVFRGDRITYVGRAQDAPKPTPEDRVLDLSEAYVLPGLINAHEHLDTRHGTRSFQERAAEPIEYLLLRAARNCLAALMEGVTTVRDCGGKGATAIWVKRAVESGLIKGPRVFTCGQPIAMTGGHGDEICLVADGVDAVRHAARTLIRAGADFIKCMASGGYVTRGYDDPHFPQYTQEELRAAFEEAHSAGRRTTVHAHPPVAIRRAVEAGVDCIEHAGLVDRPTAELLAERGIPVIPTLAESWVIAERGEALGRPRWLIEEARAHLDERMERFGHLVRAGVRLGCGTDVAPSMWEEMFLMYRGGLSAMRVIQAATRVNAEILGIQDCAGSVEPGKWADLVVLSQDPLDDLRALQHVVLVVKAGEVYEPRALATAMGRLPL